MGLINAAGLAADSPAGVPLIGYHNLVTVSNISSTTSSAITRTAANLANPATWPGWIGGVTTGPELITINSSSPNPIDYVGVVGHNWHLINGVVSLQTTDSPPVVLITPQTIVDGSPIIFRFAPQVLGGVAIKLDYAGLVAPFAGVVYVGKLLVLERSINLNKHVPITYGRRSTVVSGMSENANFLGRIVTGEYRESKAEFEWFTPTFYRTYIDPFLAAAQRYPFFWAWSPVEYPKEVGYCWIINNPEPEVDPATRRIGLTLEMRGVA